MRNIVIIIGILLASTTLRSESTKKHIRQNLLLPPKKAGTTPNSTNSGDALPGAHRKLSLPGTNPAPTLSTSAKGKAGINVEPSKSPCNDKYPIETFMQISSASRPQPTASGGLFFISDLRESPQIFFQGKPGEWPEQITFFTDGVNDFQIGPDGTSLLLTTQVDGDEQFDLHLLDASRHLIPLVVNRAERVQSFQWGSDGKSAYYTSNLRNKVDMDLYRFDFASKTSTLLVELKGYNNVTDVSPNGQLIAITNFRSITDSDILVFDTTTKNLNNLTNAEGKSFQDGGAFTKDSKGIFYLSDRTKGLTQVVFQTLTTPSNSKLLTAGPFEIESFELSPSRTHLAILGNQEGYSVLNAWQIDANGQWAKPIPLPKPSTTVIREPFFSHKGSSLFFAESSTRATNDIWEWSGKKKLQWTKSTQGLMERNCFVTEELIHYPSFDKLSIPAFLFEPSVEKGPGEIRPFIIYVHGGPESQYRPSFSKNFQYFLQRGFGILALNIRGSSGYGREYTLMDNYKKRMDSVRDVVEAGKWLVNTGRTKAGHIFIYGGSYGGFLVLRTIQVAPELFAAASESVGIANFVTFLENTKGYRRALREIEYGPLSDKDFLKSISPTEYLDDIKTPLLIFHGANDPRVPVTETEQIVAALKKRDIEVDFRIFTDEGHGNRKLKNILEQARLMAHFFEKELKKKEANP